MFTRFAASPDHICIAYDVSGAGAAIMLLHGGGGSRQDWHAIVNDVLGSIQGGMSFADALGKHPRVFSKLYVIMVRAGEAGGVLELILERLVDLLESSQELKEYITSSMIYPILLTGVCGITIILLLTFIIPKFSAMFEDVGKGILASAQLLLGASEAIKSSWWLALGVVAGAVYGIRKYLATENGRVQWDGFKLKLLMVKTLVQKIEVARFSRTLEAFLAVLQVGRKE